MLFESTNYKLICISSNARIERFYMPNCSDRKIQTAMRFPANLAAARLKALVFAMLGICLIMGSFVGVHGDCRASNNATCLCCQSADPLNPGYPYCRCCDYLMDCPAFYDGFIVDSGVQCLGILTDCVGQISTGILT